MAYTITIELRVDHDTHTRKEKDAIVLKFSQLAARELLTKACMVQDRRAPTIMVSDGDFFSETKDVAIFGDDDPQ